MPVPGVLLFGSVRAINQSGGDSSIERFTRTPAGITEQLDRVARFDKEDVADACRYVVASRKSSTVLAGCPAAR